MKWNGTQWNHGVPVKNNKTGGFVAILASGSAHLNSVQSDYSGWEIGQTISIEYAVKTVDGKPKFIAMDRGAPANFSVMIAHGELDNRWYAAGNPEQVCAVLQKALDKGAQQWSIKMRPKFWQDVNGKQSASGFKKALGDARIIQVVFGGKFRAHGVQVAGGKARIVIKKVSIK